MSGVLRPEKEGVTSRGSSVLDDRGFVQKYPLRLGLARTLQGSEADWAFFTPAILYLYGGFRDAPFADLIAETGVDVRLHYRKFSKPLFAGLEARSNGSRDWNHVLWAVRREHWGVLSDWLVSLTLTYAESRAVAGIGQQELTVVDPLAVDTASLLHADLPLLAISAFGLNASHEVVYLKPADSPLSLPTLARGPAGPGMRKFAEVLYGGGNPLDS